MEKQQVGLITSVVINVVLAVLLIFFIFKLTGSTGTVDTSAPSPASKILLAPDLGCVQVSSRDALLIIDVQNDFMPERPYTATSPRNAPPANALNGSTLVKGNLAVAQAKDIVSHINPLIDTFEAGKGTIIYSLDWHPDNHCSFDPNTNFQPVPPNTVGVCKDEKTIQLLNENALLRWPVHCVQGTWGAQFDPHLKISNTPSTFVVKKGFWDYFDSYSAFGSRVSKFSPATDAAIVDSNANWEEMTTATRRLTDILKERKIERLFVVGIATDYCVRYSIEDALKAIDEIPGLAIATIKEAVGAVKSGDVDGLFSKWRRSNVAILSEKNKDGKALLNAKC